ncbi:uncharacterized protein LOC100210217 isoform X2 [Hydra vulgaris]|uniref:uncharacterized protein LOC100210217 isoform X2 n=1 Tax=Hydra vulgaris TaxID=6087 RepID=UPI001F5F2110|nr:uncharacterized protein LOC100210217 isoform X2 [Hydra vulgaris]
MIWIIFVFLLTLQFKESSTQEYTEVLSMKNFEVKEGKKVATLMFLSKSFSIDFEFCFTTVGLSNKLNERVTNLFRFGQAYPKICDLECELRCESRFLNAYIGPETRNQISLSFGNCLAGEFSQTDFLINPGCVRFQITQLPVDGTYWYTIKVNRTEVKYKNMNPKELESVDIFFSDFPRPTIPSILGVVKYLRVANADCCTLSAWTAWEKCSSTCNMVFFVPRQKRTRTCLENGSNCKGESLEQLQSCNELVFCTDYNEVIKKENFEVKEGLNIATLFLSKAFKIDFEFCFTTIGESNNLDKRMTNLFRFKQARPKLCDFDCEIWKRCESRYLTAYFGPTVANGINIKFGQCLDGTYSEKDLSINPGCKRFQIVQVFIYGYYWFIVKVDNVELFNFPNLNPKDLQYVDILFSDVEYASQPGVVTYLNVANADCCALSEWAEWSQCTVTCRERGITANQHRSRNCLNVTLNKQCYRDSLLHENRNCMEIISCSGNEESIL